MRDSDKDPPDGDEQQELQGLFRNVFENAVQGIVRTTLDGRFVSVNPAYARMMGYASPDEVLSNITDIGSQLYTTPGERDGILARIEREGSIRIESRFRRKDGQIIWVAESVWPVRGEDGRIVFLEAIIDDISERKAAEAARDDTFNLLTGAIDSIEDGAAIYDADERLVHFNRSYTQYFSLVDDILEPGITFGEIFQALAERGLYDGPEEGRAAWIAYRVELFRNGTRGNEFQRNDGRWVQVDYYTLEGGGTFVFTADITERKQAEISLRSAKDELERRVEERTRDLQSSEARLSEAHAILIDAIESIPEGFVLFDADRRLVICNERYREFYGYSEEDAASGALWQDLERLDVERGRVIVSETSVAEYVARRGQISVDPSNSFDVLLSDGRQLMVQDRQTTTGGLVSIHTDVTKRKQSEIALLNAVEEAEIANRSKTEFLANMSHELRTPLNSIIGFSQMLSHQAFGPLGNPRYETYAKDICGSGIHLLELISDILDISRIESGGLVMEEESLDLKQVIRESKKMVQERADAANLSISSRVAADVPKLRADSRQVKQILLNLLSNAIKFTPAGGKVGIRVRLNGSGGISIEAKDTGIGIAPENINRVMEPFFQVKGNVMETGQEGTGLGLSLVKSLAENHGATVSLKSAPGRGATVTVTMPPERSLRATD